MTSHNGLFHNITAMSSRWQSSPKHVDKLYCTNHPHRSPGTGIKREENQKFPSPVSWLGNSPFQGLTRRELHVVVWILEDKGSNDRHPHGNSMSVVDALMLTLQLLALRGVQEESLDRDQ